MAMGLNALFLLNLTRNMQARGHKHHWNVIYTVLNLDIDSVHNLKYHWNVIYLVLSLT